MYLCIQFLFTPQRKFFPTKMILTWYINGFQTLKFFYFQKKFFSLLCFNFNLTLKSPGSTAAAVGHSPELIAQTPRASVNRGSASEMVVEPPHGSLFVFFDKNVCLPFFYIIFSNFGWVVQNILPHGIPVPEYVFNTVFLLFSKQ